MKYRPLPTTASPATRAIYGYITARRINQAWLAAELGIDATVLNRKLRGTSPRPSERLTVDDIHAIADVLDLRIDVRKEWIGAFTSSSSNAAA